MSPIYVPGKVVLSRIQQYPAVLGEPWGGGYFAGYISHTADGNPTHALIVAPRATGATGTGYTLTTNRTWAANTTAPDGVNYSTTLMGASVTGSITGTTMTVTAVSSGKLWPGQTITGTTVALGTVIASQISGTTNGAGDYTVSKSQTVTSRSLSAGFSEFDGVSNGTFYKQVDPTVGSGSTVFPAANFCESLTIGGFDDWYLPAIRELEIAYFNLKPTADANVTTSGINSYSVPQRSANYTTNYPAQTHVTAFNTALEAFLAGSHWASLEPGASLATRLEFTAGGQGTNGKTNSTILTRAFRRIAL